MHQTGVPQNVLAILANKTAETRIAVVGASNDPSKYGNIIVKQLDGQGYTVLPINPREASICGLTACPNVSAVPQPVDIVNFVTPPVVTKKILEGMVPDITKIVWFQDGSWDDDCIEYAEPRFETVVYNACIMVVSRTARA